MRVPPIFVSHGLPSLALDLAAGAELKAWADALPRPRGILVVSAHWTEALLTRGSTAPHPKLVHDDAARAEELSRIRYPAPGASELAYEVATLVPVERSERGWDHGVWTPLVHMYPDADIPVLQLSLVSGASPRRLFGLGRRLGVLASRGYLLLGSGGITNNLSALATAIDAPVAEWARTFDGWVANLLADAEIEELLSWRAKAPTPRQAHPTSEHLDPLFVIAGAASLEDHAVGFPIRGFSYGSLSRRCVQFGR